MFYYLGGLVPVCLFVSSVSVQIGVSVLSMAAALLYLYMRGKLKSHLSSQVDNGDGKKDCQNFIRFFGVPYNVKRILPNSLVAQKRSTK